MYPAFTDTTVQIFGASDVGQKRRENQDHFLVGDLRRQLTIRGSDISAEGASDKVGKTDPLDEGLEEGLDEGNEIFACQDGHLMVVADGMGGLDCGEQASRVAVEAAAQYVLDMMHWFVKLSPDHEDDFLNQLSQSLSMIQNRIWRLAETDCRRMGTTVTMAYLVFPKLYVVHAGDSRCYLQRGDSIRQLTTDHTVAEQLVSAGTVAADDPNLQRWRHVLWNCVGADQKVQPEAIRATLKLGDTLLLCSDGLSNMLTEAEISEVLANNDSPEEQTRQLIDRANQAGGKDNITAVVCQVLPSVSK